MNFGDILDKWEKQSGELYDKDALPKETASSRGERRSRLLRKKPDEQIDLHGLNQEEAWIALETFFENSRRQGNEKVLIVHGKGNPGVLRELSRRFIEACPFAGESGFGSSREGGTGATWVILKEKEPIVHGK